MFKSIYSIMEELPNEDERETSMMLVQSWVAVVSRIMQKNIDNGSIQSLERHIKIFLTLLYDLESVVNKDRRTHLTTTSNLHALFNVCDNMKNMVRCNYTGRVDSKVKECFSNSTP